MSSYHRHRWRLPPAQWLMCFAAVVYSGSMNADMMAMTGDQRSYAMSSLS